MSRHLPVLVNARDNPQRPFTGRIRQRISSTRLSSIELSPQHYVLTRKPNIF
jgi:hypothetical protein